MNKIYLAGPMRGYPLYNFPAFDRYTEYLTSCGYEVTSPAQLDREAGFDPNKDPVTPALIRQMILRDCKAITEVDGIMLMPGWEPSSGVKVEKSLGEFLSLPIEELKKLQEIGFCI